MSNKRDMRRNDLGEHFSLVRTGHWDCEEADGRLVVPYLEPEAPKSDMDLSVTFAIQTWMAESSDSKKSGTGGIYSVGMATLPPADCWSERGWDTGFYDVLDWRMGIGKYYRSDSNQNTKSSSSRGRFPAA
ncbi:hypothetical protein ANO11243_057560 [Dothideomycetidae sp. 11243]|nr:hypothetical protein ANO11243_057560 [fungal sp. No.11243]